MCNAVCLECVEDTYLKQIIQHQGQPILCSVCQSTTNHAFTTVELGALMEPIMREHFLIGNQNKRFFDDYEEWIQEGEPLEFWVYEVLGQEFDFQHEIVDAICDAEDFWPGDGEDAFWDTTVNYVESRVEIGHYYAAWDNALSELKTSRRFFSPSALSLFSKLFENIEDLYVSTKNKKLPIVRVLPVGSKYYRARIFDSHSLLKEICTDPFQHIGPPPPEKSHSGRMNIEGVSVFYGAREIDTALAELRPAIGNEVVVINVETTRSLRLLDLTRLDKARSSKLLSYFQPNFTEEVQKQKFLRRLHELISQPIIPGREKDYLITQTMGEYLAYIHPQPFDGILFASAQRTKGTNIVLFSKQNLITNSIGESFGIKYIQDSLMIYSTVKIKHTHSKMNLHVFDGEPYIFHDQDYEDD